MEEPAQNLDSTDQGGSASRGSALPVPTEPPKSQTKRRKVPLACTSCRDRKTRCDGARPFCKSCQKRGIDSTCLYEESSLRTQRFVWALEERLRQFEKSASAASWQRSDFVQAVLGGPQTTARQEPTLQLLPEESQATARNYSDGSLPHQFATTLSGNTGATDFAQQMDYQDHTINEDDSFPTPSDKNVTAGDAMATTSPLDGTLDCLYGASSTIAFVRHVFQSTNKTAGPDQFTSSTPAHIFGVHQPAMDTRLNPDLTMLPRRHTADSYLRCYWEIVHPVFPCLHRPSFESAYARLWNPTTPEDPAGGAEDPVQFSILNLVFALGCQFSDSVPPGEKSELADQFYQRSVKLVPLDAVDFISVATVQSLLLTTIYLQSTQYSSRCWNTAGFAIRAAQSLGLHLDQKTQESGSKLKREMRRRVWHVCITLDCLLSMSYGRPPMISQPSRVPMPLMTDDESLLNSEESAILPAHSQGGLFIHSLELFGILNEIMSAFYSLDDSTYYSGGFSLNSHERSSQQLPEILRLNAKLDAFLETIPNRLQITDRLEHPVPRANSTVLEARVLNCRYLYIRLLLLRPLLLSVMHRLNNKSHAMIDLSNPKFEDDLAIRLCKLGLDTAHDLVALLSKDLSSVYRCSAWYSVYFTFGAIIIIVAAQLCPALDDGTDGARFRDSWSLAMTIFEAYSPQIRSASHAIQALKTFRHCLSLANKEKDKDASVVEAGEATSLNPSQNFRDFEFDWRTFTDDTMYQQLNDVNPDPLTQEWFSQQVLGLDFQNLF